MRIAQVAPLFERVPPVAYGGTERVVAYLTDALVELGHDVTLFASGDSQTRAQARAGVGAVAPARRRRAATRWRRRCWSSSCCRACAHRFDVIHFHTGFLHLPLARHLRAPSVTTMHGRLDLPELVPLMGEFADVPFVSISNDQRRPFPMLNWCATVYHGLPPRLLAVRGVPGRLCRVRRPHLAREAPRSRDRDRRARRPPAAHRGQDRCGGSRVLRAGDRAADAAAPRALPGRDRRDREGGAARRRAGAALSDRLAGAVRHGGHRGAVVRHAGAGLAGRLGSRADRAGRDRLDRRLDRRCGCTRWGAWRRSTARRAGPRSTGASPPSGWPATT